MNFEPRRAKPGQSFTITGADGAQTDLTADDDGVVRPTTAEQKKALDLFGLPVARKAMADDAAADAADEEPVREARGDSKGGRD
jgi:hypothetical protein